MGSEIDVRALNTRKLTPEEWEQVTQRIIARARDARARDVRAAVDWIATALRTMATAAWDLARQWWHAWALRRARKAAIRELHALDDRTLKDIGLGRSEIESAISDPERLLARSLALTPRHGASATVEKGPASNAPIRTRAGEGFRRAPVPRAEVRTGGQRAGAYVTASSKVARKGCAG